MKRTIVLILLFSLIAPLVIKADSINKSFQSERIYNLVGTVESINPTEKSFELKVGGLASRIKGFFASLFANYYQPRLFKIITDENTLIYKKSTQGVVSGTFSDLIVGLRVQVKGKLSAPASEDYRGTILAKNIFILTPASSTTTSITLPPITAPECRIDSDCTWCGNSCLAKSKLPRPTHCPDVRPPLGVECKCQNGLCKKVPVLPNIQDSTSTSTSNGLEGQTAEVECIPMCYVLGGKARGWAWRCKDPITNEWQWRLNYRGSVSLIKIDTFCNGCEAKCLYKGTTQEGYYSSCTGKLIVLGCKPPFSK